MAKTQLRFTDNHQSELVKILRDVGYRHSPWKVFQDFVAMGAIALSNATDLRHRVEREAQYMRIVGQYTKEDADALAKCFAHVVMGLEAGMCDFLGELYMRLELGNSWTGQFFSPYPICRLMAGVTMGDKTSKQIEAKGFITVCDPAIGGGAMVIAAAHNMKDMDINYQQHLHAVGTDIDITAVHMAFIQAALLHIPAVIYHGNSLSMEVWSVWRTPAHTLGCWDAKLRRAGDSASLTRSGPSLDELSELGIGELVEVLPLEACKENQSSDPAPVGRQAIQQGAVDLRAQLALF